eukprot:scaffold260_cov274-Pinguiococcus_pyrenoidosus.AAC.31
MIVKASTPHHRTSPSYSCAPQHARLPLGALAKQQCAVSTFPAGPLLPPAADEVERASAALLLRRLRSRHLHTETRCGRRRATWAASPACLANLAWSGSRPPDPQARDRRAAGGGVAFRTSVDSAAPAGAVGCWDSTALS